MVCLARKTLACAALTALAACTLDKPESARAFSDRWARLEAQTYFASTRACTVAVYRLQSSTLRSGSARVYDLRQGVARLRQGRAVAFADTEMTPDAMAQAIMSADLHIGVGLVSSVTGPRACMTDEVAQGVHRILTSTGIITIYDPSQNVLLLVDTRGGHAVFLRGVV